MTGKGATAGLAAAAAALALFSLSACGHAGSSNSSKNPQAEASKAAKSALSAADNKELQPEATDYAKKRDQEVNAHVNTRPVEIEGEVVDSWCYCSGVMGDGRGPEHAHCAKLCVSGGVTAGILADDGKLYIAAKHQGYKGCNRMLLPYVAKRVRVKGWVAERGGIRVLKIASVEPVVPEEESSTPATESP